MRTTIYVYILIIFSITSCQMHQISSSWIEHPPEIDGKLDDWPDTSAFLIDDERMALVFANDRQALYLGGVITDKPLQRAVSMRGLTIWLDPNGGRSKRIELRIPAATEGSFDERRGGFWGSYTMEQQERAAEKLTSLLDGILVRNRRSDQYRAFPADGDEPFTAARTQMNDQQVYELRIPLQFRSDFLSFGQSIVSDKVALGVEITRVPDSRRDTFGPGADPGFGRSRIDRKEYWLEVSLAKE